MNNKLTRMTKDDKQHTLVPKLRFPEFLDAPEWRAKRLGDALRFQPGYPFPSTGFNESENGLRLIRNRDLRSDDKVVYYSSPFDQVFVVNDGDVLIGMDGDFTPCVWRKGEALLNQRVGRVIPKGKNDLQFLRYFLTVHLRTLEDATARTTVKHLSHSDVESIEEPLPKLAEQQKIADCLGSLDDLIVAEGRKLEALRDHKKGLMQRLFPREGETQPRLRFPEFRDKEKWEEKQLRDVADVLMCKRIFASETNPNGDVPFFKIGTLGGYPDAFISKKLFEEYKSKYNFPRMGEILITCSGTIGKCLPYDGREAYYQDSNIVWIDNPTLEVSNEFLLSILNNVNWSTLNSTTITRIYGSDLRGLHIKFPQRAKEQQRIADCLTALDTQIAAQAAKIDALKTHKRGLMQQLFPSSEES